MTRLILLGFMKENRQKIKQDDTKNNSIKQNRVRGDWYTLFHLAEDFYKKHGHLLISGDYVSEGYRLGRWIETQRQDYRKGSNPRFTGERIRLLESIGMVWNVKEAAWQQMYEALAQYKRNFGTSRVPQSYVTPEGKNLGVWLNCQRLLYRQGRLEERKKELLLKLNVMWDPEKDRRENWEKNYLLLCKYAKDHGRTFPPADYISEEGVHLGQWMSNQRSNLKKGSISEERKNKLKQLGFYGSAKEERWEQFFSMAKAYREDQGHLCMFFQRSVSSPQELSDWLSRQRIAYKKGTLPQDKIRRLESIGMIWDVRSHGWEIMYEQAQAFYCLHGHLRVSKDTGPDESRKLGQWISTQRAEYKKGTNPFFTEERIKRLEAIGMVWEASVDSEAVWENWYEKAAVFFGKNGHLFPPKGPLRTWILAQRAAKRGKRGMLSADKIKRLEAIGMVWEPEEERWQQMYRHAAEYYKIHDMLNIPCSYVTPNGAKLGRWIAAQRSGYRNFLAGRHGRGRNVITEGHVEMLNRIGMIWDGDAVTAYTSRPEKIILFYLKAVCSDAEKLSRWQSPGFELDVYIPSLSAAIEYDGVVWHRDRPERDEEKGRLCRNNGIRLIRIREKGLPPARQCDLSVQLAGTEDSHLEDALRRIFSFLALPCPDIDIARDNAKINRTYKDHVSRKWDRVYQAVYRHYIRYGNLDFAEATSEEREEMEDEEAGAKMTEGDVDADEVMEVGAAGNHAVGWDTSGVNLKDWIYTQRKAYHNDELTDLQVRKLEKLGMIWDAYESRWMEKFRLAKEYKETFGHLRIPVGYKTADGTALGSWLAKQREAYRKGKLSLRKTHMLERMGVIWSFRETHTDEKGEKFYVSANWYKFYDEAVRFFRQNGHLRIPISYTAAAPSVSKSGGGLKLGSWLSDQRSRYRGGKLPPACAAMLEDIGIEWNVFDDRWEEMFSIAEEYSRENGGLWLSPKYVTPEGVHLGEWISNQRSKFYGKDRSRPLTDQQIARLEAIGMIWDPYTAKWMAKYKLAKEFYLENGHLKVPSDYVTEKGEKLGMWLGCQRQAMRGNPNYLMTEERKRLLDEIGMDWTLRRTGIKARKR